MKKERAFTLIEILIVVTIIGILSSIAFLAIGDSQAKARDTRRKADVVNIKKAVQMFRADKNRYPICQHLASGSFNCPDCSGPVSECSVTDNMHGGRGVLGAGHVYIIDNDGTGTEVGTGEGSVPDLVNNDAGVLYEYLHPFPVDPHIKYYDKATYYAYADLRDGGSYAIGVLTEKQNSKDSHSWTGADGKTYFFCKSEGEGANSGFWISNATKDVRCKF